MKQYRSNFTDFSYEAHFRTPLFPLAANPVRVLEALHSRISPKYPIAPGDMVVDAPGKAVGDVRARVSLFAGNGSIEVAAESFTARFTNPRGNEDVQIIQDCLELTHEALAKLSESARIVREETVMLRLFCQLTDGSPADKFLKGLSVASKTDGKRFPVESDVIPGFFMDLFQDKERWTFNFQLSQAARSKAEMFLSTSVRFFEGTKFASMSDKARLFGTLIGAALGQVGLEAEPAEAKRP